MSATHLRRWQECLDELEAALAGQRAALERGPAHVTEGPVFAPPPDLPPLPAALADRAAALLERCRRHEAALGAAVGAARRDRALTRRMRPRTAAPTAGFLDQSA